MTASTEAPSHPPDPSILRREIGEQPEVLARLLDRERATVARLAAKWRRDDIHYLTIAARGSSDNAATYAKYLFGAFADLPVVLAAPSLHTLYQAEPRLRHSIVLAISQSGESPDILAVVADAKKQGAPTLAITNSPNSTLAASADDVLLLHAGLEESVAATKTFTTSIGALALFGAAWLGTDETLLDDLLRMPEQMARAITVEPAVRELAATVSGGQHFAIIGRGYSYATAFETALKLKELTYVAAEPYSSADFLHGPIAIVDDELYAMVIAPSGLAHDSAIEFVHRIRAEGGRLIGISDQSDFLKLTQNGVELPRVPEWLSPLVTVIPGQLLALYLARAKGYDVDRPRRLTKVTKTT
ncbi:MAG TPA: SIS domain-containing protein [Polyangiaceae bacterium]|nr:SIS domain-containing protein [Polyangiaceae bacterium]